MRSVIFLSIILSFSISLSAQRYDGKYYANFGFYNLTTGTNSKFVLQVEIGNISLIKVRFPDGWMDEGKFVNMPVNNKFSCSYILVQSQRYCIQITKKDSDLFNNVLRARQCKGII